jgi:hypothetical protein
VKGVITKIVKKKFEGAWISWSNVDDDMIDKCFADFKVLCDVTNRNQKSLIFFRFWSHWTYYSKQTKCGNYRRPMHAMEG